MSTCSLRCSIILTPVRIRKAPNTYSTHAALAMSAEPAAMKTARNTSAPTTPKKSTRCWYCLGTAK